ncbi:MAG: 5'-nucleotidase C-terminal domain-containing protein [Flavobacteriales bacterium]
MFSDLWHKTPLIFLLFLMGCQNDPSPIMKAEQHVVKESLGVDSAVHRTVQPYKKELDSSMKVLLGYSKHTLRKGKPEGPLGNFVADLILERTQAWAHRNDRDSIDMALMNNGGLRRPIPEGPVRKGRIYRLMPFENLVEVVELDHSAMKELFSYLADRPQPIAGAELEIRKGKVQRARIGNRALDRSRTYRIATSNFLAEGGVGMDFLQDPLDRTSTGIKVRDMIIRHIKALHAAGDSINGKKDGRIRRTKEAS